MRRGFPVAAFVVLAASVAGCGYSRAPIQSPVSLATPTSGLDITFPAAGVRFRAPHRWNRLADTFGVLWSGQAVIALWRYKRNARPPVSRAELASVRTRLIAASRARDPTLELIRTKLSRIDAAPTVVLDAIELIDGRRRRVRSLHMFVRGAEIVLDEYAPIASFHSVDHAVFSPINHSLKLLASHA